MLKSSLRTKQAFECCIDSKEKKTGEGKVGRTFPPTYLALITFFAQ